MKSSVSRRLSGVIEITPSAQILDERWQQILAQFELWTQIWTANPEIARRSGRKVEELCMPIEQVQARYAATW